MTIRGFDAAQARYDSMLPADPAIFYCPVGECSNEDCEAEDHDCYEAADEAGAFDPPEREYDEDARFDYDD